NESELVGHLRQDGQTLGNVQARDTRADGPKRTADLGWCLRFQVESLQVARSAIGPEEDDGEVLAQRTPAPRPGLLGREQLTKVGPEAGDERTQTQPPDLEPAPAIERPRTS